MKGFVIKDLLLMKGNLKILVIVIFGLGLMVFNNIDSAAFLLSFISVMMLMSTFSYDDYNKWDAYALTLPNGRKNLVKSKYVATLLLMAITSIISFLITYFSSVFSGNVDLLNTVMMTVASAMLTCVIMGIMYPILYKFGTEKGRIIIFVGVFVFSFGIGLILKGLSNLGEPTKFISMINDFWYLIFPIISIIILFISYQISKKIYVHKEF